MKLKELEQILGLKEGFLKEAANSEEEVSIDLGDLKIFKSDEFDTLKSNIKETHEKVGLEKAIKEMRNELGYSFEGKTLDNLLSAHLEANKNNLTENFDKDQSYKSLESSLKTLQTNFERLQAEKDAIIKNHQQEEMVRSIDSAISSAIKDPSKYSMPVSDIKDLFKLRHQVEKDDNLGFVVKKEGEVIKDNLERPVTISDQVSSFAQSYLKKVEGGAGGEDQPKAGSNTKVKMTDLEIQMSKEGLSYQEKQARVTELAKEGLIEY